MAKKQKLKASDKKQKEAAIETLDIPLLDGGSWTVEVLAKVGDLAVHVTKSADGFTVTHLPTLLGLSSIIPEKYRDNDALLTKWAEAIQKKCQKDWLAMRKFKHDDVMKDPERTKAVRERVRDMAKKERV